MEYSVDKIFKKIHANVFLFDDQQWGGHIPCTTYKK